MLQKSEKFALPHLPLSSCLARAEKTQRAAGAVLVLPLGADALLGRALQRALGRCVRIVSAQEERSAAAATFDNPLPGG